MTPSLSPPLGVLLLTIILLTPKTSALFQCDTIDHKKCLCFSSDNTEIQCPRAPEPEITLTISRQGSVSLQCMQGTVPYLDIDLVPEVNLTESHVLGLEYCYVNGSFSMISEKLNMTNVTSLSYELMTTDDKDKNITLMENSFENMTELESLSLSYCNLYWDSDFLVNTPNLLRLVLSKDKIVDFNVNLEYVPKLQVLDLTSNQINVLEEGVFDNVQNLSIIYMYSNKLTNLTRNVFRNLTKLKLLELSSNQISDLAEDTFADLTSLVNISLRSNKILMAPKDLFTQNTMVENIRLDLNPNIVLADFLFANLTKLRTVNLQMNNMSHIPGFLFEDSKNLREIYLHRNNLEFLTSITFEGLGKLKILDLSRNRLSFLPKQIFSTLVNLEELNLSHNKLVEINKYVFKNLVNLKRLSLQNNRIALIDSNAFASLTESLTYLDLSYNEWNNSVPQGLQDFSPINRLIKIEELDLKHNNIAHVPALEVMLYLKRIDLSFNMIQNPEIYYLAQRRSSPLELDLSHNQIQIVLPSTAAIRNWNLFYGQSNKETNYDESNKVVIKLQANPIFCNCSNFNLVRYNNDDLKELKSLVELDQEELMCVDSKMPVLQLKPRDVECSIDHGCPSRCSCAFKPYNNALVVNCSNQGLLNYPRLDIGASEEYNQTILILNGNNLTSGPLESMYNNVTNLDLSNNSISNISWIPPRIKILNLNYNKLKTLDSHFVNKLRNLTTLESIRLKGNPWECTCDLLSLQNFIYKYYHKVNASDVYCENKQQELAKIIPLCKSSPYLTVLIPVILIVLLCFSISVALYYRYQTEVKIYLYSKNFCTWLFTEKDLDPSKEFDAFVSFSNKDVDFVAKLVHELENGDVKFKLCHHAKDWLAGETIVGNIVDSVEMSRRTIIVLSNNFIESQWAPMEFILAHDKAMKDRSTRVIVIIYGDLDREKLKNNQNLKELASYLETNTYLEWGEKYFWNKLKYALPHKRSGFYARNRKHNELMLKIDDKFSLAKNPPSPTNTSTPPIMTLDPGLLENKLSGEGENPLLNKGVYGTEIC